MDASVVYEEGRLDATDGFTHKSSEEVEVVAVFGGCTTDCCRIQSKQKGLWEPSNVVAAADKSCIGSKECISNEKTLSSR